MRLFDYQRYTVEVGEGYVWFEAPLRAKPSGNRLERAYQRMPRPMPGLGRTTGALALRLHLPEHHIDLYPDQVTTWQINPDGPRATHDRLLSRRKPAPRCAPTQRLNHPQPASPPRTPPSSPACRRDGDQRLAPGPLGEREAAVAWFADRVGATWSPP